MPPDFISGWPLLHFRATQTLLLKPPRNEARAAQNWSQGRPKLESRPPKTRVRAAQNWIQGRPKMKSGILLPPPFSPHSLSL